MDKTLKIILAMFLFPILLLGVALLLIYVPLPRPFPEAGGHDRNFMAAIITGVFGMVGVISLMVYVTYGYLNTGRVLDTVFSSRGLTTSSYLVFGRQYEGQLDGRQVLVQFTPPRSPTKGLLNIWVQIDLNQHMAIGMNRPLLDCSDCKQLDVSALGLGQIQVFAADLDWSRNFLAEPTNLDLVNHLMEDAEGWGMQEIYLQPGWVWLHARPLSNDLIANVDLWFENVMNLAKATATAN
jgi:hypothetical protein